jgi:hypothetical protein
MREEEANLSVEIVADVAEKLLYLNPTNRAWTVLAVHHLNAVDAEGPLTSPLKTAAVGLAREDIRIFRALASWFFFL